MPKIRLSALATDIKGKSGGSVFSTNSGGTYFRNNPSGGGRKSNRWDLQKGKFAAVARAWRNLTNAQQTAWNNAVSDYPTVNAFGEPRIPSGYELFMRLNGTLISAGIDPISVPGEKRSLPSFGNVDVVTSDFFQFVPSRRMSLFNTSGVNNPMYVKVERPGSLNSLEQNVNFSFRIQQAQRNLLPVNNENEYICLIGGDPESDHLKIGFIDSNSDFYTLFFSAIAGANAITLSSQVSKYDVEKGVHISLNLNVEVYENSRFVINGVVVDTGLTTTGTFTGLTYDSVFYVNSPLVDNYFPAYYSDLRLYQGLLTEDELYLQSLGYVVGDYLLMAPLDDKIDPAAAPYSDQECDDTEPCPIGYYCMAGDCVPQGPVSTFLSGPAAAVWSANVYGYGNPKRISEVFSPSLVPVMQIEVDNPNLVDTYVNVYATPPLSNGKTAQSNSFKLLGTFEYNLNTVFDVTEQYREAYGFLPFGNQVQYKIALIDGLTGVENEVTQIAAKKPKFKAGAELNNATNK